MRVPPPPQRISRLPVDTDPVGGGAVGGHPNLVGRSVVLRLLAVGRRLGRLLQLDEATLVPLRVEHGRGTDLGQLDPRLDVLDVLGQHVTPGLGLQVDDQRLHLLGGETGRRQQQLTLLDLRPDGRGVQHLAALVTDGGDRPGGFGRRGRDDLVIDHGAAEGGGEGDTELGQVQLAALVADVHAVPGGLEGADPGVELLDRLVEADDLAAEGGLAGLTEHGQLLSGLKLALRLIR